MRKLMKSDSYPSKHYICKIKYNTLRNINCSIFYFQLWEHQFDKFINISYGQKKTSQFYHIVSCMLTRRLNQAT